MASLIATVSEAQLRALLIAPNAKMRAGGMAPVVATPDELTSLTAYLLSLTVPTTSPRGAESVAVAQPSPSAVADTTAPVTVPAATADPGQPPSRTSAATPASSDRVSPQAAAGRALFIANGCAACHGPSGYGTQFAPTLIGIHKKFPGDALPYLLHHPTVKMRNRGMPAVTVNDAQMKQLTGYLATLGTPLAPDSPAAPLHSATAPAVGQPPTPASSKATPSKSNAALAEPTRSLTPEEIAGGKIFERFHCETCHGTGGLHGTVAAPGLAGTASMLPPAMLENLLRHHSKAMQQGGMPLTNMNPTDMKALVAFIHSMPIENPTP